MSTKWNEVICIIKWEIVKEETSNKINRLIFKVKTRAIYKNKVNRILMSCSSRTEAITALHKHFCVNWQVFLWNDYISLPRGFILSFHFFRLARLWYDDKLCPTARPLIGTSKVLRSVELTANWLTAVVPRPSLTRGGSTCSGPG